MDSVAEGGGDDDPFSSSNTDEGTTTARPLPRERERERERERAPNFIGKHRMAAAIALLHQQIQIIQEELDQLETLGESSIVCKELLSSVESKPDALLPVTKGPADVGWDRWFQGAHSSRNRKRWI